MTLFNFAAEHLRRALYLNPPLGVRTTSARANDGQAEIRSAASPGVADQGLALSGMAQTTPWAAEGLTLSSREEKLAHYLLSRGKTAQLERLLAKARAGVSTGLTSPAAGGHAHSATGASRARRTKTKEDLLRRVIPEGKTQARTTTKEDLLLVRRDRK